MKRALVVAGLIVLSIACGAAPGSGDASDSAEALTALQRWHVSDSGIRCFVAPCPSLTAEAEDGASFNFTDLDLSRLGLSQEENDALLPELLGGEWIILGRLVAGPTGPSGQVIVMQVFQLVDRADPAGG